MTTSNAAIKSTHTMSSSSPPLLEQSWIMFVGITLWYAPLAFDYFFPYVFGRSAYSAHRTESAWDVWFSKAADRDYAMGRGSYHEWFTDRLARIDTRKSMLLHATCGAMLLTLSTIQFISPLRRAYPRFHRYTGYAAFFFQLLNLGGSAHHLIAHGAEHFSGKEFTVALWAMWLFSCLSMVMSYVHIARKEIQLHRAWAALNYATINSSPGIRIIWTAFHKFGFEGTLAECNAASALLIFDTVTLGVFLFLTVGSATRPKFDPQCFQSVVGKTVLAAITLVSFVSVAGLGQQLFGWFPEMTLWGFYHSELRLATTIPLHMRWMLLGGLTACLVTAPIHVYKSLTTTTYNNTLLRAILYMSFSTLALGAHYVVPIISYAFVSNTWPIFYTVFCLLQCICFAMEYVTAKGAQQMWILLQWGNLCTLSFVFCAWPLFPALFGFDNRRESYNSAMAISIVAWVPVFFCALYMPLVKSPNGGKLLHNGAKASATTNTTKA